jgi:hypothetical protein
MFEIRQHRLLRRVSLRKMAQDCDLDFRSLSAYELGKRQWPLQALATVCDYLGLPRPVDAVYCFSWTEHLRSQQWHRWSLEPETASTWAQQRHTYSASYKELSPKRTPPLHFLEAVRCDSGLEALAWSQLCEAGARPAAASPVALGFAPYALVDPRGFGLGLKQRPCLWHEDEYLLFPQVTLLVQGRLYRPDALLLDFRSGCWHLIEIDGGGHNSEYDLQRDLVLHLRVFRFTSGGITGLRFASDLQTSRSSVCPPGR